MCWFKVTVRGTLGYAGTPRGAPGFQKLDRSRRTHHRRDRSVDCAVHRAQQLGGIAAGGSYRGAYVPDGRSGRPFRRRQRKSTSTSDVIRVPRPPRSSAQFAEALSAIAARHPRSSVEWEMVGACPGRRHRSEQLDHSIVPARMGARRGASAWRPAAAGRSDRRRADPPYGNSVRANRLSLAAAQLPAGVPARAGRMGVACVPDLVKTAQGDHVRGDRHAYSPARGTWTVTPGRDPEFSRDDYSP